jgi:hypothetical protein
MKNTGKYYFTYQLTLVAGLFGPWYDMQTWSIESSSHDWIALDMFLIRKVEHVQVQSDRIYVCKVKLQEM